MSIVRDPATLGGRTAVISGAVSGIGRALALQTAGSGMAVAACVGEGLARLGSELRARR
ncbi:MAG: hypothetical protein V4461_13875 [Pseudomonadota bacterium]